MSEPDYLGEGLRLFNEGAYWHAHEAWETAWLGAAEPDNTFYKGIIQTAAALVHWQRGNQRGLHRNWYKARPKLVALPLTMHGLDLGALIVAMDRFVTQESGARSQESGVQITTRNADS